MSHLINRLTSKAGIFLFFVIAFTSYHSGAQTAKDVLEKGERVKSGNKIFLRKEGTALKYDVNEVPKDFTTLEDEKIFLVEKNELNIYIRPLNPLNFQLKTTNVVIVDPITEAEANASKAIFDMLETVKNNALAAQSACGIYDNIKDTIESVKEDLGRDQKATIVEIFKKLKLLGFEDADDTKNDLEEYAKNIAAVETHFKIVDRKIKAVSQMIKNYTCGIIAGFPDEFTGKFIFSAMVKELETMRNEQIKRLANLQQAYKLVKAAEVNARKEKDGLKWFQVPDGIPATQGKISVYTITVSEGGYGLSDQNEIVAETPKEIIKRTFKVRKFQRFVPEVSAGTVYTFFDYPKYGTSKDASGNLIVADAGKKNINNLKYTAMINYNFFTTNSPVHFFWQIGVGVNSEVPTLLTGIGIRANFAGIRRLALAGGLAFSWIKNLDKLKIGDQVTGTSDIEKDLKYEFNKKKPLYVGLQYNF